MNKQKYVLFDFDGVLVNTEPIYDIFWNEAGVRYGLGENFASKIKGTTITNIYDRRAIVAYVWFRLHPARWLMLLHFLDTLFRVVKWSI